MRVFNLTNEPTPVLKSQGLVNVPLRVGSVTIKPGESEEVPKRTSIPQRYLDCGALAVNEPPSSYSVPKAEEEEEPIPDTHPVPTPVPVVAVPVVSVEAEPAPMTEPAPPPEPESELEKEESGRKKRRSRKRRG